MRPRSRRRHFRRAATMLEFVLVFPFALVLVMFSLDIGRVYMTLNAAEYAASRGARAGALYGAAGKVAPATGAASCATSLAQPTVRSTHMTLDTFCRRLSNMPGGEYMLAHLTKVTVSGGDSGSADNLCSTTEPFVSMQINASVPSYTPGIALLLDVAGWDTGWPIQASASALCDIIPVGP